ncbi:hypothetical protein AB9P05_06590 [Roseivirga sp. BDSF3-8]|uniref:hypothetical protein n=1 Tax=Roseivirga sp. BDSF3-8 TaxID=3241598 RepID=UPI0035318A24
MIKEAHKHYAEGGTVAKPGGYTHHLWASKVNRGLIAMDPNTMTIEPDTLLKAVQALGFEYTRYKSQDWPHRRATHHHQNRPRKWHQAPLRIP